MTDFSPKRKPRWRWGFVAILVLLLSAVAVLVPGSPIHISHWLVGRLTHDGRTASEWKPLLSHPDAKVRQQAAFALGCLNNSATDMLPALAERLRTDPDANVRSTVAEALTKLHPATRIILPDLIAGVSDPEPRVRMSCILAINRLKTEARSAIPALLDAAEDEDNDVDPRQFFQSIRQAALRALGLVAADSPDGISTFQAVLASPAPDATRAIAVSGLGLAGPHAKEAAPQLRALLKDANEDVRLAAAEALERIGVPREGPTMKGDYDDLELPVAERERLWALEHAGNVLNTYGFEPLSAAVRSADSQAIARFLSTEFSGTELSEPVCVTAKGFTDVVRRQPSTSPARILSRNAIVAKLLEFRNVFSSPPKVKLVLATIHPRNVADPNGVWEGKALLRMHGEHAPNAPAEVTATLWYELAKPTEAGLASGGWLKALHIQQATVAKSPRPMFQERAQARGLKTAKLHDNWTAETIHGITGGVFVTDYDRDGYLDLLITDRTDSHTLYRGGPDGSFTDRTDALGLNATTPSGLAAAWIDLDGDGWDDLILGSRIFRNEQGTRFTDRTEQCRLNLPIDASSILVADFDNDGKIDLYVTRTGKPGYLSWLQGRSNDPSGNRLFRNLGNWQFEDATKKAAVRGGYSSSFTAAWLDANNDGWPDLHVPNEFGDGILYVNQKNGTFQAHKLADYPVDFGTMGLAAGDLDNDSHIDLYCANMYSKAGSRVIGNLKADAYPAPVMEKFRRFVAGSQWHRNKGNLTFEHLGAEKQLATVGWAYGPTLADLDGDGFLDIYATAGYISRDRSKPDG